MPLKRTVRIARTLRQRETDIEYRLWQALRGRRALGLKFRRQHPIGPFVADFVCIEAQLVIEIDGYWHTGRADADGRRTLYLRSRGFDVVRFNIETETSNVEVIAEAIAYEARERIGRGVSRGTLTPNPSPSQAKEREPCTSTQKDEMGTACAFLPPS